MSNYTIETWTIRGVANAFNYMATSKDETDSKVVIPIFQRGLRWDPARRRKFIDSLEKGYPFGSLLFAKQEGINKYSVVDGLQRGSTVCDYVFNPLGKDNITAIDKEVLNDIKDAFFPDGASSSVVETIEKCILEYFHEQKQFEKVQMIKLASKLMEAIPNDQDKFELAQKITDCIQPFYDECLSKYNTICSSAVPIVVYCGPQNLLSEIFNRINTKGIPLNDYEIYSATWSQKKYVINDIDLVKYVLNKYLALSTKGFVVDGFDSTELMNTRQLTAFEWLFALGKQWGAKYDCLKLEADKSDDEINEVSFEIVDACLNTSKSISTLDKKIQSYDVNKLKKRIEEAIEYVDKSIKVIGKFKGNKRKYTVLHSNYQIISLISYTFRKMYEPEKLDEHRDDWEDNAKQFSNQLLSHYVADVITNEWHDGGAAKVYVAINEKRYDDCILKERWEQIFDEYYHKQLQNKQRDRFSNPVNADSIILNCVYVNLFSAKDQLSNDKKFDIEHLATKERMRAVMKQFADLKLPISCISNLCYLPEDINRGKKEKTIYEATDMSLPIAEIEKKYSFTKKSDLDWILYDYMPDDRNRLIKNYETFLQNRYKSLKKRFVTFFYPD